MMFVLPSWVTLAATVAVAGLAFVRGGGVERLVGGLALADFLWSRTHHYVYGADMGQELAHDTAVALVMTLIAVRANAYWTLASAAVWVVSAGTEVAQILAPVSRWAYGAAEITWYYLFLASLAWGAWRAPARRARLATASD
jgi:hypothetical protein